MRLDQGSLIFNPLNGECPSWETALGQSHEGKGDLPPYHFKAEGYENLLKGVFFNAVPLNTVSCILGKTKIAVDADTSSLYPKNQEIQLAGKFDKVVVHLGGEENSFSDAPITLLLTKIQDQEKFHYGRRSIKYSPHTSVGGVKNSTSFERIQSRFSIRLACYGIFVEHFDTLHMYCVDADESHDKNDWKELSLPETEWTDWAEWEKNEREKNGDLLENSENSIKSIEKYSFTPSQIIYYGVPGSGKSNKIKELLKDVPDERKERVVFHPEYTNADFVGQILPVVHDGVDYKFTPGPFTKMVAKAYKSLASENPEQFYLVIEEINRGNAAAIFGDVFQLLDRIKPGETDSSLGNGSVYTEGWSQYFVYNEDINSKILELAGVSELEMGSVKFTKDSGVRLPPNLSILATMNTSDQNVFTLDNAFQRRFAMKMIPNELDESSAQYNMLIDGTGVCWGKFREWINKKVNEAPFAVSTEDKCLGGWFICGEKESEDKCKPFDKVEFAEKVLKYLWDDAFKRRRPDIFESNVKSLSDLISRFCEGDGFDSFTAVFKMNDADVAALKAVSLNPPAATAEPVTETA